MNPLIRLMYTLKPLEKALSQGQSKLLTPTYLFTKEQKAAQKLTARTILDQKWQQLGKSGAHGLVTYKPELVITKTKAEMIDQMTRATRQAGQLPSADQRLIDNHIHDFKQLSSQLKPQTTNHKPQTTNHKPQTTNHKPQTTQS